MATAITTDKGFLVIEASQLEVVKIGGLGICDACNKASSSGNIISVLAGRWYCPECFNEWHSSAINYEEDREYEKRIFEKFKQTFSIN